MSKTKSHKQMDHTSKGMAKHLDELRKRNEQSKKSKSTRRGTRGGTRG